MRPVVLVVDDSPDILDLVAFHLRGEAVDVATATGPAEAREQARALRPTVILLDLDVGGTSGIEVCRALKADPTTADAAVVFLTATAHAPVRTQALDAGGVDFVTKPVEPVELRARVRLVVRLQQCLHLLATRAQIDGATGLWNRKHFDERLLVETAAWQRDHRPFSVVLVAPDHLRSFGDRYGHAFLDETLGALAAALRLGVRPTDVVCRVDTTRFGLLLGGTDTAFALTVAERVRHGVEGLPLVHATGPVTLTASCGVASVVDAEPERLVAAAEYALVAAQRGGRNRVEAFRHGR